MTWNLVRCFMTQGGLVDTLKDGTKRFPKTLQITKQTTNSSNPKE